MINVNCWYGVVELKPSVISTSILSPATFYIEDMLAYANCNLISTEELVPKIGESVDIVPDIISAEEE